MKEHFIENNIEYILAEDRMYYPNLQLPKDIETRPIGLYGALRKTFLKEQRPVLYMHFVLSDSLTTHLADTNEVIQSGRGIRRKRYSKSLIHARKSTAVSGKS